MDKYFRLRIVAQSVLMLYNTISKKLVFLSIVKKRGVLKMIDEKNIKGIKIRSFNTYMILLSCILYGMLIYATAQMISRYDDFIRYNDEYIACHESAVEMNAASDYLTDQVRLFTQNMDMQYMHNYFKEAHETQRREKALANLQKYRPTENELQALLAAKNSSMALMEREIYAMKLIALANGYDEAQLPAEVCQVQLLEVDKNLSSEAMIARARELVYNRSYMDAKAAIKSHSDTFVNKLMRRTAGEQKDSMLALDKSIFNQRLLISLLFVMNVLTFLVITVLIVRPLKMHMKSIREKRSMQTTGAYEFNYFAQTYNEMYELNEANKAMLEAEKIITSGEYDLVILDEINYAVKFGLIEIDDVLDLLDKKPAQEHILLTGRDAHPQLIDRADLVTEMKLIKHPFQKGIKAQRGIEF